MEPLVRVLYTSKPTASPTSSLPHILQQSIRNNLADGVCGMLLYVDRRYLQVLEGRRDRVHSLLERLRTDDRHTNFQVHIHQEIDTLLFEDWAMICPPTLDGQLRLATRLLMSDVASSQEVGFTYLKYWLTSQQMTPSAEVLSELLEPVEIGNVASVREYSRSFFVTAFCLAILAAVFLDIGFYVSEYLGGEAKSLAMVLSHTITAIGLCVAIYAGNRSSLTKGIVAFQVTAVVSVALHIFYAGYGIFAPSIPYLGLAVISNILGNKTDKNHKLTLACVGLIGLTLLFTVMPSTSAHLSNPVPVHHAAVAGMLFPLVCAMILGYQYQSQDSIERFAARVLYDLSKKIEALKKTMSARDYFFSAISHEIRTPMTGAMSAASLIRHPQASELVKARSTTALQSSLSNLNRLLNDLLDVSKLESGKFQLSPQEFDLKEVTRSTLDPFLPIIAESGNTLRVCFDDGPVTVTGDSMRYQQMLSNLVSNAVKFTQNGSITVSLDSPLPGFWKCEVADTGIGIAASEIEKLFQPFSQASQHGYSKTKGTGLGLAIVSSLAKQMGGVAGVKSTEGKGSTFWFTFTMPLCVATTTESSSVA